MTDIDGLVQNDHSHVFSNISKRGRHIGHAAKSEWILTAVRDMHPTSVRCALPAPRDYGCTIWINATNSSMPKYPLFPMTSFTGKFCELVVTLVRIKQNKHADKAVRSKASGQHLYGKGPFPSHAHMPMLGAITSGLQSVSGKFTNHTSDSDWINTIKNYNDQHQDQTKTKTNLTSALLRPDSFEHDHQMCLVGILKNEAPFLEEYVQHYWLLGVSFFLFFENNSTDSTRNELQKLAPYGVHQIYWPLLKGQQAAYAYGHMITKSKCAFTWFLDIDEFIMIQSNANGKHLHELLWDATISPKRIKKNDRKPIVQVCVSSVLFRHALGPQLILRPNASVVDTYKHRMLQNDNLKKCAIRGRGLLIHSRIHRFEEEPG